MSTVKAAKISKIQWVLQDFPEELVKLPNNELIAICAAACFLATNAFSRKLSKYVQTPKSIRQLSELLIPHTSQTFLRSSNTNFVEKITKAFLLADTSLYKLNNKHIKSHFIYQYISHSWPYKATCRKTEVQLSTDELQRKRNTVRDIPIFLVVDESTLCSLQYVNILVGCLETPHINNLFDCQPLSGASNSNSNLKQLMMQLDLMQSTETFPVFYCLMLQNIYGGCWCSTKISLS